MVSRLFYFVFHLSKSISDFLRSELHALHSDFVVVLSPSISGFLRDFEGNYSGIYRPLYRAFHMNEKEQLMVAAIMTYRPLYWAFHNKI